MGVIGREEEDDVVYANENKREGRMNEERRRASWMDIYEGGGRVRCECNSVLVCVSACVWSVKILAKKVLLFFVLVGLRIHRIIFLIILLYRFGQTYPYFLNKEGKLYP